MNHQPPEAFDKQKRLSDLLDRFQSGGLARQAYLEQVLQLVAEKPAAPGLQPATIDHLTLKTPDLQRASRFYQEALDMPLLRAEADTHYLGVGNSFMGLQPSGSQPAYIDHFCLGLANFDPGRVIARLAQKGISIEGEAGEDTLRFVAPDGLHIQLSSTDYARRQTYRTR